MRFSLALMLALAPAYLFAEGLDVTGAYAFQPNPAAKNGAIFFRLNNEGAEDVRLLNVESEVAHMVELHTNEMTDGVMKMSHLEDGILIPAGACLLLERGGYHVMLMGLKAGLQEGGEVPLRLNFENGEALEIKAVVAPEAEADPSDEDCIRADLAKMDGQN